MTMKWTAAFPCLLLALFASPARAGEITPAESYPLRGEPTTLTVSTEQGPAPGVIVEVLYRPNSQTSHTETLPPTGADGTVPWTPDDAGLATLTAHSPGQPEAVIASRNVAVRFGGFPASGVGMMVLAGILLFGGSGLGFLLLFRDDGPWPGEAEGPST